MGSLALTVAARALGNTAIHWQASILETLQILLGAAGPNVFLILTTRLVAEVETNLVFLTKLTLKIDKCLSLGQFLLLCSDLNQ